MRTALIYVPLAENTLGFRLLNRPHLSPTLLTRTLLLGGPTPLVTDDKLAQGVECRGEEHKGEKGDSKVGGEYAGVVVCETGHRGGDAMGDGWWGW